MIAAVVNYGIGNLFSVKKGLERVGFRAIVTKDVNSIRMADLVVLPGVGSHKAAMVNMERMKIVDIIREREDWILGICLGMQLLYERSEEGNLEGLGILPGNVIRLRVNAKVPHMGWNDLKIKDNHPLVRDINGKYFYFAHSYYKEPDSYTHAVTEYAGVRIASVVCKEKICGTQFHPEKSYLNGKKFFQNLIALMKR